MAGFMNRKFFHPSNFQNQKRKFAAEQGELSRIKREKELKDEYAKERSELEAKGFNMLPEAQRELEKSKYTLKFMYDVPPDVGAERKKEKANFHELSYKEQKALPLAEKLPFLRNAPRQNHARQLEARDKPFGMQVRNVRCFRCGQWGHQRTDRVCPLFGKAKLGQEGEAERDSFEDPAVLMRRMQRDGLALARTVLGRQNDPSLPNQQLVEEPDSDEGEVELEDEDAAFLASLSSKQKRKLLRKLRREEKRLRRGASPRAVQLGAEREGDEEGLGERGDGEVEGLLSSEDAERMLRSRSIARKKKRKKQQESREDGHKTRKKRKHKKHKKHKRRR